MNQIAVVTDIHGNLPALEASLQAIDAIGVDALYCGGNLVGYGPHPNQVCALIEQRAISTIYGNYDYAIGRDLDDCGCAYVTEHDRELGKQAVAWTLEHTDQTAKDFMRALPFDLRDGDPRAAFAILELDDAGQVQCRSSAFPTTPRRSPARSRRPGCPASMPASSSRPPSEGVGEMKYVLFVCTHNESPPARSRPDRQSPESSVRECTCCTRSTTQPPSMPRSRRARNPP